MSAKAKNTKWMHRGVKMCECQQWQGCTRSAAAAAWLLLNSFPSTVEQNVMSSWSWAWQRRQSRAVNRPSLTSAGLWLTFDCFFTRECTQHKCAAERERRLKNAWVSVPLRLFGSWEAISPPLQPAQRSVTQILTRSGCFTLWSQRIKSEGWQIGGWERRWRGRWRIRPATAASSRILCEAAGSPVSEQSERKRFVKHGHYNNGWSIICPIPLLAGTVERDTHSHMKGGNLSLCMWER